MQLTLEEIVMIAVENQHIILEQELKKGVPLNYCLLYTSDAADD